MTLSERITSHPAAYAFVALVVTTGAFFALDAMGADSLVSSLSAAILATLFFAPVRKALLCTDGKGWFADQAATSPKAAFVLVVVVFATAIFAGGVEQVYCGALPGAVAFGAGGAAYAAAMFACTAIFEECLSRGVLINAFCRERELENDDAAAHGTTRGAAWRAMVLSATLFALMHAVPAAGLAGFARMLPAFVFACVMAFLYRFAGTLVAPIVAHFLYDTALFALVAPAYGLANVADATYVMPSWPVLGVQTVILLLVAIACATIANRIHYK